MSTPTLTPSQQVLLQKQQEHQGLLALRDASADMLGRIEKLAEMKTVMADGGETFGQVMKNWPHVFAILNLFEKQPGTENPDGQEEEPIPTLVRLPYTNQ